MNRFYCVTVGRQFSCGGSEIARLVAEKLKIAYYDRELLERAAKAGGYALPVALAADEQPGGSFLYALSMGVADAAALCDRLFAEQAKVIREIAASQNCVMVGRCADEVLRGGNCVRVFLHADEYERARRYQQVSGTDFPTALTVVRKNDKTRAAYYRKSTGQAWGIVDRYDLTLDTSVGEEAAAELIVQFVRRRIKPLTKTPTLVG